MAPRNSPKTKRIKSGFADVLMASGPNGMAAAKVHGFPDIWGQYYGFRVDSRAYSFDGREFLRDILRDPHPEIVCIKGAQLGVTVTALLRTLHRVCQWKWNGLYLLPVKAGTTPFTQGRIDPIIKGSPMLKKQFVSVDNANHKRTMTNNLYIRGTNVETELREIPVDFEVWDERDKMREENLDMARTRMDGSRHKHLFMLSTPTIPDYGVDSEYKMSDQRRWFIKCPHCSTQLCLDWDTHVVIVEAKPKSSWLQCDHCKRKISHNQMIEASQKGQWVATRTDHSPDVHGYHISQLYSPTRQLGELARIWMRAQTSQDAMKELKNSALGEAFVARGDKLTEGILDSCRDNEGYILPEKITDVKDNHLYFGIDVGSVLHTQASVVLPDGRRRKVFIDALDWNQIWQMFEDLEREDIPFTAVIDANPERKMVTDLALRFHGKVFIAFYQQIGDIAAWHYPTHRGEFGKVTIDRTHAFDTSHASYIRKQVILPANIRELGERRRDDPFNGWYKQMMSQVRLLVPSGGVNLGDTIAKYVQTGGPDHWDHSDVYEFVATTLVPPKSGSMQVEQAAATEPVTPDEIDGMPDFGSQYGELAYDPFVQDGGSWVDGLGNY